MAPEGNAILVEVKTTDAYRIPLDRVADYRHKLQEQGKLVRNASTLIVVGREDTGELEAQVRGSKHAWDMRLISVVALLSLVRLKESTDAEPTGAKIRSVLVPMEYTRLDRLVDVMFTAAKDAEASASSEQPAVSDEITNAPEESSGWEFTDLQVLEAKRESIRQAMARRDDKQLVKRSRALYWDSSHSYRAVCTISKRHGKKHALYWYAYHPTWDAYLLEGADSFVAFGCVDLDRAFVLPSAVFRKHLTDLHTTSKKDGSGHYWHVKIAEQSPSRYTLQLPKRGQTLPLDQYELRL